MSNVEELFKKKKTEKNDGFNAPIIPFGIKVLQTKVFVPKQINNRKLTP